MRPALGLAALAASWGLIGVLVGAVEMPAITLAFLRLALAAVTLAAFAAVGGRVRLLTPGPQIRVLVLLGIVQALHWALFFETVKRGSVALAVLTFYVAPLFLAVLAPLVLSEQLSNVALGALVPAGIGLALVVTGGAAGPAGVSWAALACGLGSALSFSAIVIISKRLLSAEVEPLTVAFWDCLVGAAALAPLLPFVGAVVPVGAGDWGAVLLLGIVFTGASTLVYTALLRHVTAQTSGILTFLEPVSGIVLAWLLLDEPLAPRAVAGGALVLVAGIAVVAVEPGGRRVGESVAGVGSSLP